MLLLCTQIQVLNVNYGNVCDDVSALAFCCTLVIVLHWSRLCLIGIMYSMSGILLSYCSSVVRHVRFCVSITSSVLSPVSICHELFSRLHCVISKFVVF